MKTIIYRILWYLKESQEDEFGQFSGKRILGTLSILTGLVLTCIVSANNGERIAEQVLLISPTFATGLAFWGLTSWQSLQTTKLKTTENISNKAIEEDSTNTNIEIKQP